MNEKRFTIHKENMYKEDWYAYPFCIKEDGEVVLETIPLYIAEKVRDKLNEQQATIKSKDKQLERLYNYFQDYLKDEMSGNAFSEMWDFVKEDEKWEDE